MKFPFSSSSSSSSQKQRRLSLFSPPRRFTDFSPQEREAVLLRWMRTKGPLGQSARGLKSLVFLALFRFVEEGEEEEEEEETGGGGEAAAAVSSSSQKKKKNRKDKRNPFWEACSYSSPSLLGGGGGATSSSSTSGGSPRSNGNGSKNKGPPPSLAVSPAKVATEATLLARTVDASKLRSKAQAEARFSALGFAPVVAAEKKKEKKKKKEKEGEGEGEEEKLLTLDADAIVVGSGAGGGVAAALLASSGLRVVVLEKGRYFAVNASSSSSEKNSDCEPLDLSERAFLQTYEKGTLCSSRDLSATALAGSTLGGGTRINWCASFPTPSHVREEWSRVEGLPVGVVAKERGEGGEGERETGEATRFDRALAAVCSRMKVGNFASSLDGSPPSQPHNGPNSRLAEGLVALGRHAGRVPRNCFVKAATTSSSSSSSTSTSSASPDCGRCCFSGCPSGDKQDHTHTFLADAARAGALVVTGVMAERVLVEKTRGEEKEEGTKKEEGARRKFVAVGVEATPLPAGSPLPFEKKNKGSPSSSPSKPPLRLVIRAPVVVAAAGSLHTPALLLRSGLRNKQIGRGLRLHPSLVVLGRFPRSKSDDNDNGRDIEDVGSVRMDRGPIMSAFGKGRAD